MRIFFISLLALGTAFSAWAGNTRDIKAISMTRGEANAKFNQMSPADPLYLEFAAALIVSATPEQLVKNAEAALAATSPQNSSNPYWVIAAGNLSAAQQVLANSVPPKDSDTVTIEVAD